jgi:GNAT superfamily N-acetyltransferase
MNLDVSSVSIDALLPLRELYRREMSCQIIHDSFARRGFSNPYLLRIDGRVAGYGLVANRYYPESVHEFYLSPEYRSEALPLFRRLLEASRARGILTQTNDRLLLLLLYDCAVEVTSETVLFEAAHTCGPRLECPGATLRPVTDADREWLRQHDLDSDSHWLIEREGAPIATGGVLGHYNLPYGDLYMQVHEAHRRRGVGSYLIQELQRISYEMGRIPAARCDVENVASRRTLERAGMLPCGRVLQGVVRTRS